jgi:energy-coupling factor transport system ATP-binding protein
MWEERDRPPHMLSPGQQQRVAIAGALAMRPQGMVFDEATAMLDPQGRKAFWTIVDKLRSDGLTVIYVTHDMDEATRADRVLALQQGQLMLDGPPGQALVDAEYLATLGLALPTVPALVRRLRRQRPALPMSVLTAQELAAALKEAQRA